MPIEENVYFTIHYIAIITKKQQKAINITEFDITGTNTLTSFCSYI